MNILTKKTAIIYLIAVFLVGGVAGGMSGYCYGVKKAFTPPGEKEIAARMTEFAREKLHLTDEQLKQVQPILNETAAEFATMHTGMSDRINEIIKRANERIAPFLTPEQKILLDELEQRRQEQFQKFFKKSK